MRELKFSPSFLPHCFSIFPGNSISLHRLQNLFQVATVGKP